MSWLLREGKVLAAASSTHMCLEQRLCTLCATAMRPRSCAALRRSSFRSPVCPLDPTEGLLTKDRRQAPAQGRTLGTPQAAGRQRKNLPDGRELPEEGW